MSSAPRFRNTKALQEAFLPGPGSYVESATWSEGGKLASFSCSKRVRQIIFWVNYQHKTHYFSLEALSDRGGGIPPQDV